MLEINKIELIKYYNEHTIIDCSKNFNCSCETIKRRLISWGIELRTKSEAIKLMLNTTLQGEELRKIRSNNMKNLRKNGIGGIKKGSKRSQIFKDKVRKSMKNLYNEGYVGGFQKCHNFSSDKKNSHWDGGCSNNYWKQRVIAKYGSRCNRCGWDEVIEILECHHKDFNKNNNVIENGEVLCPICHRIIHFKERGFR